MLPRQLKEIQFDVGLMTKGDRRSMPEQLLDIAVNVEFDDIGGLRCRYPFDGVRTALVGGGTLTNARRLAVLGNELVCFTQTALYSWIPALSAWEYRGDHLAVATDEQTVCATPGDQSYADRAELNGHIVYCWQTAADGVRYEVRDKASGAIVQGPTTLRPNPGVVYLQPRLIALQSSVLLFWVNFVVAGTTTLMAAKITVAPFAISASATISSWNTGAANFYYDVCRIPGQDRCYAAISYLAHAGQFYAINSVDSTFAGAQTAAVLFSADSEPIAIAVSPDAAYCTVVTSANGRIYADVWNVTAANTPLTNVIFETRLDATAATQIGTVAHVTAAYRLTQDGGQYRCYVFWSGGSNAGGESITAEAGSTVFRSCSNWINAANATGGDAIFVCALGIAARAFARDSHVYLIGCFAGLSFAGTDPSGTYSELQNTYYLYRDDAFLLAKAVWGEAGTFQPQGWLPNVVADSANANAMMWMGAVRRIVPVGKNTSNPVFAQNYAERAPREVAFTFDDNRARRCVQFGQTLYVLGGLLLQYDGAQLVELGTCTYPWYVSASTGPAGAIAAAGYSYKGTDRWMNAKGEVDRSTTATVTNWASPGAVKGTLTLPNLYITRKTGAALEVWRTQGNPPNGAPFFLASSQDPSVVTGDNDYLANNPASNALASFSDNFTDAQLAVLAAFPENNAVLPNIEPPPATIVFTDNQRLYLAGIPGMPNTVYYSKYRQDGRVAAFNDALAFDTPPDGGAITAIGSFEGVLIVWCTTATYAFAGVGNDDTGGGANFQLSRILSKDTGSAGPESIALLDEGFMVNANKGKFLLDRSLTYQYVGAAVAKYDGEAVLATYVLTQRHQVRVLTSGRMLVYDTLVKQWAESSIYDGLDSLIWNGNPAYLTATGVRAEMTSLDGLWAGYAGVDYTLTSIEIETGWIKFGQNQSRAIVDFVQLLGELRSACAIRKRLAKDYEATAPDEESGATSWNYHTDLTWQSSGVIGSALQVRQSPRWKRCEAFKARFTITNVDGVSPLAGPCARLTSIVMPFAIEPGAYGALAASQKQ